MNFTVQRFDSVDSTNTEALRNARIGAAHGTCIIARQQTAGRGRQGRVWISPPDAGLYLSVVLRPHLDHAMLPVITLAAAIAVHDALTELGLKPDIKWPNDVLVNEKKISGILAETAETADGLAVVVGIGVNVMNDSFPPEIVETATSIMSELGHDVIASDLEESLLGFLSYWYERLQLNGEQSEILGEWAKRSTYFRGKHVKITLTNEQFSGVTEGLESNGALRVRTEAGDVIIVQAGDVERMR